MPIVNPSDIRAALPRLRASFESSRTLVERARERAVRAAEHAQAMQLLLESYRARHPEASGAERQIWDAARTAVMRVATERDRVLGAVAHELRQPLAAALAAHRLLAMRPAPAIADRAGGVLERQLLHLSKLVDSVLDFSRLTLGAVVLERCDVDLREVIARAVEAVDSASAPRAHDVEVSTPPSPLRVAGDATRLLQVFSNLLDNAVRYSPQSGTIAVAAATVADAVHVSVTDSGAGIAPNLQLRMFEPFTRGSPEGAGLGIGLALARTIVELHGGSITVSSAGLGQGSTFTVILPLARPENS